MEAKVGAASAFKLRLRLTLLSRWKQGWGYDEDGAYGGLELGLRSEMERA